jgi:acetylornithine deacetylase
MLEILERLVAFDTTSDRSNLDLIGYVEELLAANAIRSTLHPSDDGRKANLVATAGEGKAGQLGLILSGHTDVVPVAGQSWSADPFTLRVTADRAVGRGAADMKGFIACCLAVLTTLDVSALTTPLSLVLTYDEEVGCVGARRLVEELRETAVDTVGCVVGEPTDLQVVVGHKGKQNHRARFTTEPMHAALAPRVTNAIGSACAFVARADALNERLRADGPRDERFDVGHSWVNVGRIEGGVKPNIVAEDCVVEYEVRAVPGHSCDDVAAELRRYATDELLPLMRQRSPSATVELEQLSDTPSFAIDESHEFVKRVSEALGRTGPPVRVPFGTEAGLFWGHAGIPTVVWGPGSIGQAHTADEWVSLSALDECLSRLLALPLA